MTGRASWPEQGTIEIRSGLPNRDLGYPCTVCGMEGLISIYYTKDGSGVTGHPRHWLADARKFHTKFSMSPRPGAVP